MIKKILSKIIFLFLVVVLLSPTIVLAAPTILDPTSDCMKSGNCDLCDLIDLFVRASDVILYLSGAFAVIMFVFGGMVMITAYGTESRIQWGKSILNATVVGIIIVLLAWTLVNAVMLSIYGNTGGNFSNYAGNKIGDWGVCAKTNIEAINTIDKK